MLLIFIGSMSDKKKVNTLTYLFLSDGRGLWHSPDFTKHHFRTKETTELVEIRKKIPEECCLSMMNSLSWMFNNQRRRIRGAIYTFRLQKAL